MRRALHFDEAEAGAFEQRARDGRGVGGEDAAAIGRGGIDDDVEQAGAEAAAGDSVVLTTEDEDQAIARMQGKGRECAEAAVEMANLLKDLA